ncbi:beta-ketoacyl synthase N-terminal-like domain-containing protein [Burkholderia oklahomensis]|uniref:type I polyketide synthase n=1 Tax=Burkholderia oklahomensis TaxID=342113 RepID=UPI00265004FC|nr:beta-ketoacyl synthase N-terminal-like domain-containing protein [Burkholderia oklahomensis]MDN7671430.1 beta-ketoacyl synthase N-terminal-like domain-containing protein [Burkholderia oklahomensis]
MRNQLAERDIAVIGMACRFPGANDPDEYWHNLINGVESLVELGDAPPERHVIPVAAPLSCDVLSFDAAFFGVGHRDAALMDPQHRLFLECAWHALEDSGTMPGQLKDAGLFAGCSSSSYLHELQRSELMEKFRPSDFELQITNDKDYLVSRAAWHLGIEGPVLGVQAACATSLVAVAEAVEALRAGRCRIALAGGCTVRVPQRAPYRAQQGMIYARNGHCMPFSRDASGTVFGSGVALVVLKPLAAALADGQRVLAVIKGCAVNNDGADKVGFTTTSVSGQRTLIGKAMRDAGLAPADIRALEAHGTGTIAGDPIEFDALNGLFAAQRPAGHRCALGSVKANVGHLETCAGMAGLIKAVLEIHHGWITPQIHVGEVNPGIALDGSPFYLPPAAEPWDASDPRSAIGVSAFGIGGTNAHVLVARPDASDRRTTPPPRHYPPVIPVSARSEAACHRLMQAYRSECSGSPADALAWSAQTARRSLRYRGVLEADATGALQPIGNVRDTGRRGPRVVFQFPGQGSQFVGMAAGLAQSSEAFAALLRRQVSLLRACSDVDASFLLIAGGATADLSDTATAQPALIAVQIAMARFLIQHGVVPDAVIGHSVGEIAGACIAGMLTDEQALLFAARRGWSMSRLPGGAMLAVALSEQACGAWLSDEVSLAAVNGSEACVLSGAPAAIGRVESALKTRGIRCRTLAVSHAFHSVMMDPALPELASIAPTSAAASPDIRFHSTLLGAELAEGARPDAAYWARHAREPVRLREAIESLPDRGKTVFVEVGPGATLTALSLSSRPKDVSIRTLRSERDETTDAEVWHTALRKLWMAGLDIDWRPSWNEPGTNVRLPHYPFEGQRHGAGADRHAQARPARMPGAHPSSTRYATLDAAADALWEKATGIAPSNPHQPFSEDGGDSLAAIRLVVLAESELSVELSLPDFMRTPTPTGLRACLAAAGAADIIDAHNSSGKEI